MTAEVHTSKYASSEIDLVVEVRGVEQGNRPVSVSFRGITVRAESANGGFVAFDGPYEVFSLPGSKSIDMAVEAPIFVGLIAHVFGPAEGLLCRPHRGRSVPSIWALAGFETTLTATTRFFGYKAGSTRSPVQVGLSQLTGKTKGSSFAATHISNNMHFWSAPDFALTFHDAKIAIRPAGYGRLKLSAEYSWNQGEWTAKTNGLLLLDGNPLSELEEGAALDTTLKLTVDERVKDSTEGAALAGTVSGRILRSK
jgi:hypothetical protein